MMAPAAVMIGGSSFSINSVLMQSRAVSNRTLRLSIKYEGIVTVGYRSICSIGSITVFFVGFSADSGNGRKILGFMRRIPGCGASR